MTQLNKRNIGLDILRSIAVWNVIVMHLAIVLNAAKITTIVWFPLPDGVDIFFVLSGHLIGKIIIRDFIDNTNTNKGLKTFLISRWFRTLPNYFFLLFIVYALRVITTKQFFIPIHHFFFTQNMSPTILNFYPETWSLCVEEWFYLLVPVVVLLITKSNKIQFTKENFFYIVIVVIILSPIIRLSQSSSFSFVNAKSFFDYRMITYIRFDSIAYGLLSAYLGRYCVDKIDGKRSLYFKIGMLLLVINTLYLFLILNQFISPNHLFLTNFNFIFNGIGILLIIPKLELIEVRSSAFRKIFEITSKISYSLYLLQMTIILNISILIYVGLGYRSTVSMLFFMLIYLFVLYVVSYGNYYLIEDRFLKIRDRVLRNYRKN